MKAGRRLDSAPSPNVVAMATRLPWQQGCHGNKGWLYPHASLSMHRLPYAAMTHIHIDYD